MAAAADDEHPAAFDLRPTVRGRRRRFAGRRGGWCGLFRAAVAT
jgi:hypothetical protein